MNKVITIGREFGSGGREIGVKLAEKYGIPFYDKEIITLAAEAGGFNADFIEEHEEKAPNFGTGALGRLSFASFSYQPTFSDSIFISQCDVIRDVAAKGPCVIVGRCAEYVLKGKEVVNIFVTGTMPYKIKRKRSMAPEKAEYSDEQMAKYLKSIDKQRRKYYEHYTDLNWADCRQYDICLNTDIIGCDGAVQIISEYLEKL